MLGLEKVLSLLSLSWLSPVPERGSSSDPCGVPVKFFNTTGIKDAVPPAPSSYPEVLLGRFWLDESGVYGFANTSDALSDFVISFGDALEPWDPVKRTVTLAPWGRSWTWFNKARSYQVWGYAKSVEFAYTFHFNQNVTAAQIIPRVNLGVFGKFSIPTWFVSATMRKQTPPPGACPPPPGATREAVSQCAAWIRETRVFPGTSLEKPTVVYPIFKIADNTGSEYQPTYNAGLQWALNSSNNQPDPDFAQKWLGIDDLPGVGGMKAGQAFNGANMSAAPGWDLCKPAAPCQDLWTVAGVVKCILAFKQDGLEMLFL